MVPWNCDVDLAEVHGGTLDVEGLVSIFNLSFHGQQHFSSVVAHEALPWGTWLVQNCPAVDSIIVYSLFG